MLPKAATPELRVSSSSRRVGTDHLILGWMTERALSACYNSVGSLVASRHQHCSVKSNPKFAEHSLSANSDAVGTGAASLIEMPDWDEILARNDVGNDSRI